MASPQLLAYRYYVHDAAQIPVMARSPWHSGGEALEGPGRLPVVHVAAGYDDLLHLQPAPLHPVGAAFFPSA